MEFYNEKLVTAKKAHSCHICTTDILSGEDYYREAGVYENEFFSRCTCIPCYGVQTDYMADNHEDDYSEWCIADYASEHFCSVHHETNPCADCGYENPLLCHRVREYYERREQKWIDKQF